MSICVTAETGDDELIDAIVPPLWETTRSLSKRRDVRKNDPEYQRLCPIRRRAERKALRTKSMEDLRASRRAQTHVTRHLNKLRQQRWRSFCAMLNARQPLTRI